MTEIRKEVINGSESPMKGKMGLKRKDYISWDEYFMYMALLTAKRSKDPSTQVGAVIVSSENIIVGCGYNGMPIGCHDDKMPWGKDSDDVLENKYFYVCHAEMNAILNSHSNSVRGGSIYTTMFPCVECAKLIIQSRRISQIVYLKDKPDKKEMMASKKLFDMKEKAPELPQSIVLFDHISKQRLVDRKQSAYFGRVEVAFPGAAAFFKKQSAEELKHAQKLIDFQNNCGGKVALSEVKPPKSEWNGLLDAFNDAVEMEKAQKHSLLGLHDQASKSNASDTTTFVDDTYLVEQLMEIQTLVRMVNQLKRMGPGLGEQLFDKHLLKEVLRS